MKKTNRNFFSEYTCSLSKLLADADFNKMQLLAEALHDTWRKGNQVFLCGNGGSAANAAHIASDLIYGVTLDGTPGIRAHALIANQAIVTCLANDCSYEEIFSRQLVTMGKAEDLLIALSGSGNSKNIIRAIACAKDIKMQTSGIFGYNGGSCLSMVDIGIHCAVNDMQIAEDLQLAIGHMLMRWLREKGRKV